VGAVYAEVDAELCADPTGFFVGTFETDAVVLRVVE
jgi:hypothetical protein